MKRRPESSSNSKIVLVGGGVHAVVVAETLRAAGNCKLMGYVDLEGHDPFHMQHMKVPNLGTDQQLEHLVSSGAVTRALLAIAGLEHSQLRRQIADRLQGVIAQWHVAIHPTATLAESVVIGHGTVVFAAAVINPLVRIGQHAVINTSAVIEHHCRVDDFAVISPQATLCGGVRVESGAFVGAGAVIVGDLTVGSNAVIGAGSVVLQDVQPGTVVAGNPARLIDSSATQPSDLQLVQTP